MLAIVGYIGWFNDGRLRGALGDIGPVEFEVPRADCCSGRRDSPIRVSAEVSLVIGACGRGAGWGG